MRTWDRTAGGWISLMTAVEFISLVLLGVDGNPEAPAPRC